MKTKSRWLLIVLVALLQVAMLLLAEIGMFCWLGTETTKVTSRKVFEGNLAILQSMNLSLKQLGNENDSKWLASAIEVANRTKVPDDGFITVNSLTSGETLNSRPGCPKPTWNQIAAEDNQSLLEDLRNKSNWLFDELNVRNGIGLFGGEQQLITVAKPADRPVFFAIHRDKSRVLKAAESSLAFAHRVCFGLVLFIGLVTSMLTYSILTRFKNRVLSINDELQQDVCERAEELRSTKNAVIFGLAKLAESRDNDTGEHLDRIRSYVTILANDLSSLFPALDCEAIENLAIASSLHDIGKVGIPDSILLKPGRLSETERCIMQKHAIIGGECLEAIQARLGDDAFMNIATQVAFSHHERWDGTGYPHGVAEEKIPLVARIVSVADVYDALTSKRPYKKAMSHAESRAIIVAGSGTQFDPEVVSAFLRHETEFEMISIKQQFINDDQATSCFQKLAQEVGAQTTEERNSLA